MTEPIPIPPSSSPSVIKGAEVDRAEPSTLPPRSNRLSDAPSATGGFAENEARFFDGLVRPCDLSVVLQPIVRLDSEKLFAYEALVRCVSPKLTPVQLFERAAMEHSTGRL